MSQASSSGTKAQCKHCQMNTHVPDACPFLNTNCIIPGCNGMMKLMISTTEKNPGRKFLKCDINNCNDFQWMDHVVLASLGYEVPDQSCYICGDPKHWVKDCKWNSILCGKNGCKARKVLMVSKNPNNLGRKYLKCFTCKAFEWVKEEATSEFQQECAPIQTSTPIQTISKTYAARVVNEATVDGLCVTFETHISFKRNE